LNLFAGVCILNECLFIGHGRIFSIYNVREKEWKAHFKMRDEILHVFRQREGEDYVIGIVTADGGMQLLRSKDPIFFNEWEFAEGDLKIEGQILRMIDENESDAYVIFISQVEARNYSIQAVHNGKLKRVKLRDVELFDLVSCKSLVPIMGTPDLLAIVNEQAEYVRIL